MTCNRMLRNLSWASEMEKARSLLEQISLLRSFLTLFTHSSPPDPHHLSLFFAATTLLPLHGRGLTPTLFPSIKRAQNSRSSRHLLPKHRPPDPPGEPYPLPFGPEEKEGWKFPGRGSATVVGSQTKASRFKKGMNFPVSLSEPQSDEQ